MTVPNGAVWNGSVWNGSVWNGAVWNGGVWNGNVWNGGVWNGGVWNGGVWNGGVWNGNVWNGGVWNGGVWNGGVWNGGVWNGGVWNGTKFQSITLTIDGSQIKGVLNPSGKEVSGTDFIGAHFQATHTTTGGEKEVVTFRFDDAYIDKSNDYKDVWRYKVSFQVNKDGKWNSVCHNLSGDPTTFVALAGMAWDFNTGARIDDPKSFTMACSEGVLEKCVNAGYRPWTTAQQCTGSGRSKRCTTVSLKNHHQACTRMLRADYCGNGKAWTTEALLDIYDYLHPPIQLQEEHWQIEARWVPSGAICLSEERHPELGFPGYCTVDGRKVRLGACQCYEDNRGLIVSTFNDDPGRRK